MMPRDPLTERYARELREVDPDPKAWIEGPRPDERPLWARRPWNRWDGLVALLLVLGSAAVAVALLRWLWKLLFT
jgi:hypothetical protein